MDRLTKPGEGGANCPNCQTRFKGYPCETYTCLATMMYRLKQIEDILGDSYDLDGLRELVEADREGRCLRSNWPIGTAVYRLNREFMRETKFIDGERYYREVERWCIVKGLYTWADAAIDAENPGYRKFFLNMDDAIRVRDELNRKEAEKAIGGGRDA